MLYTVLLMLLFDVQLVVSYTLNNKQVVWQDFRDVCYYDEQRVQQKNDGRERCQQIPNILVEKRYFSGIDRFCIVINKNQPIYNISIDDKFKKNNFHMPIALGPTYKMKRLITMIINRGLYDPQHLLHLDVNITASGINRHSEFAFTFQSTFINNSLIQIFDTVGITCEDIQKSMVNNEYLTLKNWAVLKIFFPTKRQVAISHSFTIKYDMGNGETCLVPVNIKTMNNMNIAEMIIYQGPGVKEFSFPPQTQNLEYASPLSIKLNGSEACNPFLARVPDSVKDNQNNINPLKFYDKCRELNWVRSEPEPAHCENLPEVIVRSLVLNGDIPFWCVTVDKKFAPSKYENDSSSMTVQIQMGRMSNFVRWYNESNSVTTILNNTYTFEVEHQIVLSIEPKHKNDGSYDVIRSLKINGVESCGLLLENSVCGVRKIKHRPFIAYGLPTYPGQYPWHAAIFEIIDDVEKYLCGGSIIGTNVVLTAAHCVVRNNSVLRPEILMFEVGRFDLRHTTKNTKMYEVVKVMSHEEYNAEYFENDIAILKSKHYMEFNDFVQPICLTANSNHFENEIGYVPGWGKNEFDERENILSEAVVPIVENSVCRASNREFFQTFLSDGKFCGGYRNGTTVCSGDSGGGLVVEFPTRWYIKGIVSIGISSNGLCDGSQYVLLTDIVYYNSWIRSKIIHKE